jgi:hypothetical protein
MSRYLRVMVIALALVLLVVGSVFANGSPTAEEHRSPVAASAQPSAGAIANRGDQDENEANDGKTPPTQAQLDRVRGLLDTAGISATDDQLTALIAKYGVGGAVRILTWADATGSDTASISDLRDLGMGWGAIAKQLNTGDESLNVSPGLGWIMSGGHGQGHADAAANGRAKGKASAPGQSN